MEASQLLPAEPELTTLSHSRSGLLVGSEGNVLLRPDRVQVADERGFAVADGLGIAFMAKSFASAEPREARFVALLEDWCPTTLDAVTCLQPFGGSSTFRRVIIDPTRSVSRFLGAGQTGAHIDLRSLGSSGIYRSCHLPSRFVKASRAARTSSLCSAAHARIPPRWGSSDRPSGEIS